VAELQQMLASVVRERDALAVQLVLCA